MIAVRRLTAPGPGGVALLAIVGPGAGALLGRVLRRGPPPGAAATPSLGEPVTPPGPGRVVVGWLVDARGDRVDEVLVARPSVEGALERFDVGTHGGPAVVCRVIAVLVAAGAREVQGDPASAGPTGTPPAADRITREVDALLPSAPTELAARALLHQRAGALRSAVEAAARALELGCVRDHVAGCEHGRASTHERGPTLARAIVADLLASARLGEVLLRPARVVVVGRPNAGKSRLVNALLGHDRVIVSPEPGTTRDLIEAPLDLDGIPIRLVDTAGQRPTSDPIEQEGVRRAAAASVEADLRLVVVDASATDEGERAAALALAEATPPPKVVFLAQVDRLDALARASAALPMRERREAVVGSAVTGEGVDDLRAAVRAALAGGPRGDGAALVFTARQRGLVEGALRAIDRGAPERAATCLAALIG